MPKYGYMAYTYRIHPRGQNDALALGDIGGGQDSLVLVYGALRGLAGRGIKAAGRYLRTELAEGIGRTVQFKVAVGQNGVNSSILDPEDDDKIVFKRASRHIEATSLRGLIVAPTHSQLGIIILEVQGRSSAKSILFPALKRALTHHTQLILDFEALVDGAALEQFLDQAAIKGIILRRSGLPADIADAVSLARDDVNVGQLEMKIKPGGIKEFTRTLVDRLRGDNTVRHSLLRVGGLDFSDISVTMEAGERKRTLTIDAAQIPSFTYNLPGSGPLPDETFFKETLDSVEEIARAVGVTVGASWQYGDWSEEARTTSIELPAEDPNDERDIETQG